MLHTPLCDRLGDQLEDDPDSVQPATIGPELLAAVRAGGGHELLPFAGQSVALVHDILPPAELVTRLLIEAEDALTDRGVGAGAGERPRSDSASPGHTSSRA